MDIAAHLNEFLVGIAIGLAAATLIWILFDVLFKKKKTTAEPKEQKVKEPKAKVTPAETDKAETISDKKDAKKAKDEKKAKVAPAASKDSAADAKKVAETPVPEKIPEKPFITLSRDDVVDHIEDMRQFPKKFPVRASVIEKTDEKLPVYLMCGKRCFGVMFEINEIVFNIVLCMSAEAAKRYGERHSVKPASAPSEKNWYELTIDLSFDSKRDIYKILDECYAFVLKQYYDHMCSCDEKAARLGHEKIEEEIITGIEPIEMKAAAAEKAYRVALEKYKADYFYAKPSITRREIADDMLALNNPEITVKERPKQPQLPMSLNYKNNTYAMLHGTDAGIVMTVKIADEYAEKLSSTHPEICRARFPRGANWYYLPIDGAFRDKDSVYEVLASARAFADIVPQKPVKMLNS